MGADWVIHNDADEFWWPLTGDLKQALAAIPDGYGHIVAPRAEFVARPGEGPFAERLTIREARFLRPPKSAHRAHPQVAMRGPHPVEIWVDRSGSPYTGLVGKPVLRTAAEHVERDGLELLIAPTFPVRVLHFPFRSFQQYERRVEIARANGSARPQRGGPPGSRRLRGRPPGGDLPALDARRRRRSRRASTRAGWSRTRTSAITCAPARTR